jgi:hypothetical protein
MNISSLNQNSMDLNPEGVPITLRQEEISYAYINAIAAAAGYSATVKNRFMDHAGIDLSIEVPGEILDCLSPIIDAQVKCTSRNIINNEYISYSIDKRTYDRLRHSNPTKPQILIVVLVPRNVLSWLCHGKCLSRVSTLIRASAYWESIKGKPPIQTESKTIRVPLEQKLTSQSLQDLMLRAAGKTL